MHVAMLVLLVDYEDDVCGFIHEWIATLARRVKVLDVLTLRKGKTVLPDNVRIHVLKSHGNEGKIRTTVRFYVALWRILRQSPVDVIFSHMIPIYSVIAAPVAKLRGIPLVMWYTHEAVSSSLRLAEKFCDKILTASKESFRLSSQKVIITNHGINTKIFCPQTFISPSKIDSHLTICSIGRISPRKDYETFIKAADILVHTHNMTCVRFLIIGKEGTAEQREYFRSLMKMVKDFGLEQHLEFSGSIPHREVASAHQQNDIFVNMRQTGGMDKAVLEAMACGVPTVVCNRTFTSLFDIWAEQLLFEEGNAVSLAERLAHLMTLSHDQRRQIGQSLREVVIREHNLEALMDRIVSIFEAL